MSADCTGVSASWCPAHGDCACPRRWDGDCNFNDDACPLHASPSDHAEGADFHAREELLERVQSMTAEERLALLEKLRRP